jgi:hypothetical protein
MYEEDYEPNPRHTVAAATTSYTVDNNWYANSGATDHITSELDKLAIRDKYTGTEKVHTTSGVGMEISDTSKYFIHTPSHTFELCNILHVLKATKNLMSIHPFTLDNNFFLNSPLVLCTRGARCLKAGVMIACIPFQLHILPSLLLESISYLLLGSMSV